MKFRSTFFAIAAWALSLNAVAQETYGTLPPLHVDGNYLKDEQGNKVVLHGVMDTPNTYFNGGRWQGSKAQGWWDDYNDTGAKNCRTYFKKLFTAITNNEQGAYCTLFRLHLDPAWTNGSSGAWKVDSKEKGDGEADISKYTGSRLTKFLTSLFVPLAEDAMGHGMYVIMRPPGVCPEYIQVGGSYQKFLLDVWDRVSKNVKVQKYCGQISLELANEPRNVLDANGQSSEQALHDFFQPIVEKIRANGFKGVIWIPGSGWQSNYRDYAKYPITGDNIGYAVHNYAGWYGNSDDHCNVDNAIKEFGTSVPIIRTNPIVITEVDWSPHKPEAQGHYDEHGNWVIPNYGTWATASTSKWGKAYKAILDYYGNVSMTLTGTGDYIDIDDYIKSKKVTPAFKTEMEKNGVDPYEACGVACFQWYEEYAKVNYPSDESYQEKQEIPDNPFAMQKGYFNPSILYEGSATITSTLSSLNLKKGGCSGWRFEEDLDISSYQYLVIRLVKNAAKNTFFRIYDNSSYAAEPYMLDLSSAKLFKIDLQNMTTESGEKIAPSHIRIAGFNSADADQLLYVKEIFLSNDGETEANAILAPHMASEEQGNGQYYDLSGRKVTSPTRGLYIVNGKKVFVK